MVERYTPGDPAEEPQAPCGNLQDQHHRREWSSKLSILLMKDHHTQF